MTKRPRRIEHWKTTLRRRTLARKLKSRGLESVRYSLGDFLMDEEDAAKVLAHIQEADNLARQLEEGD